MVAYRLINRLIEKSGNKVQNIISSGRLLDAMKNLIKEVAVMQ